MDGRPVVRIFVPFGQQAQSVTGSSASCRLHSCGLDIYIHNLKEQVEGTVIFSEAEYVVRVSWLQAENDIIQCAPPLSHHPDSAKLSSSRRGSTVQPGPCQPFMTLLGWDLVTWRGRTTAVPQKVLVRVPDAIPGREGLQQGCHQLQVFLYDRTSWRRVAEAEGAMGASACAGAPERRLAPPLPLRLALRPIGNPELRLTQGLTRGPGSVAWSKPTDPGPATAHSSASAAPSAPSAAGAGAPSAPVPCHAGAAGAGAAAGGGWWWWWWQRVALRAAEGLTAHTATGRHVQYMAACLATLRQLLYDSHRAPPPPPAPAPTACSPALPHWTDRTPHSQPQQHSPSQPQPHHRRGRCGGGAGGAMHLAPVSRAAQQATHPRGAPECSALPPPPQQRLHPQQSHQQRQQTRDCGRAGAGAGAVVGCALLSLVLQLVLGPL
ncbi:hypothetical protein Agub_g781, partial [Astrephomene gubernaculifera]